MCYHLTPLFLKGDTADGDRFIFKEFPLYSFLIVRHQEVAFTTFNLHVDLDQLEMDQNPNDAENSSKLEGYAMQMQSMAAFVRTLEKLDINHEMADWGAEEIEHIVEIKLPLESHILSPIKDYI